MRSLVVFILSLVTASAHACLFARDTQPEYWYEWASTLLAADVTAVEHEREKSLDVISLRVVERFKGPAGAATARLEVPSRLWASCRLELPGVGARVLVAFNPNSDTLVVPLSAGYAERLRQLRRD